MPQVLSGPHPSSVSQVKAKLKVETRKRAGGGIGLFNVATLGEEQRDQGTPKTFFVDLK